MNEEKEVLSVAEGENDSRVEAEPVKMVEIVGVGFRTAGKTYYFSPKKYTLSLGDPVIVETARGVEMGKITIANRMISEKELVSPLRDIIRPATAADISRYEENRHLEERAAEICKEKIRQHGLEMDLVSVEYTFDNSKLLFYFTAENRVDFRELVKDLASVFKTRIELRQIGIRDEAKLMGGFGVCGRPFCCSSFLPDFVQVSIKMAKEQNFSLNSAKISGACGRLMCCLRYEHDVYEEAIKMTPSVGSYVSTSSGLGTVVETRPLAGTVKVKLDDKAEAPRLYAVSDIKVLRSKGKGGLQPDEDAQQILEEELHASSVAAEQSNVPERGAEQRKEGQHKNDSRPPRKKEHAPKNAGQNGEKQPREKNKNDRNRQRFRRDGGKRENKQENKKESTQGE